MMQKICIAIHGGAGTILRKDMTKEIETAYLQALLKARDTGYGVLDSGGTAIDAVKAAVVYLEDCPLFNAGKGAVFTKKGLHELDAAIMDGNTLGAGAVAGIRNVKNPILLADEVRLHSGHVFLSGKGAHDFAIKRGVTLEPDDYFFSKYRYEQWREIRDTDMYQLDQKSDRLEGIVNDKKFGTVGAVACDTNGNIAAATSTGGMTNKKYGRIGDSPVIGAGTYANNKTCAISCTGYGEIFLRAVAAYDVSCLMEYKGYGLQQACEEVIMKKMVKMDGEGGIIGVDTRGNCCLVFNTSGMYRAFKSSTGESEVKIYNQ